MSKSLIVILVVGFSASWFTDLSSESLFFSVVLPVIDALALLALVIWIALFLQARGAKRRGDGSGGDDFSEGGSDGGD